MRTLLRFLRDESASTAIEYGLIAAGIATTIVTVVQNIGTSLSSSYTSVSAALK